MSFLKISNLSHKYGKKEVLSNLSLEVEEGSFVSLLGPSGCGKTTILKLIAGFETPTDGTISVAGDTLNTLPAHRRNMGMVFQSYALFPHMTIIDNVAYGLRQRKISKRDAISEARKALELVQLTGMEERKPSQLSGGQQQRVALARAIVIKPRVLLLDESLSALDRKLRIEMQVELRRIQREVGITTLFVTHDQEEALTLSDKIALLNKGQIAQYDSPSTIYEKPASPFVASFIGNTNFLVGTIEKQIKKDLYALMTQEGESIFLPCAQDLKPGSSYTVAVRPEKMLISASESEQTPIAGHITLTTYAGDATKYSLTALGKTWTVQMQNNQSGIARLSIGDQLFFGWDKCNSLVWLQEN